MACLYLFHKVSFTISVFFPSALAHRRRRSEEHPLQVNHKQEWGHGFIFLLSYLLYCPDQMLAVMVLSQYRVSSFKTVRPRAPCGARCMGCRTHNSVKKQDPICAWTNGIAQHQSADNWT